MKKILFDTSVYGELIDNETALIRAAENINRTFITFGSSTVRKELEDTPTITLVSRGKYKGISLKELLLWLYDLIVTKSGGELEDTDIVSVLAIRYNLEHLKKNQKSARMLNDFHIIAAASLHNMDIFVSADKLQLSCNKLCTEINTSYQLSTPQFSDFLSFINQMEEIGDADEL